MRALRGKIEAEVQRPACKLSTLSGLGWPADGQLSNFPHRHNGWSDSVEHRGKRVAICGPE
jgi:hypothetical protein